MGRRLQKQSIQNYNLVHLRVAEHSRFFEQMFLVPRIAAFTPQSCLIDRVLRHSALLGLMLGSTLRMFTNKDLNVLICIYKTVYWETDNTKLMNFLLITKRWQNGHTRHNFHYLVSNII